MIKFRSIPLSAALAVSLVTAPALAWHEVGHMLTTLVAYQQLSPGSTPSKTVRKLVAVLKHHPRFQEDFVRSMPKGLSEDGEARWLLCRASVWPDQLRGDRDNKPSYPPEPDKRGSYHRGNWHYIDTPLVIVAEGTNAEEVKALEEKARAAQDLDGTLPEAEKDVQNALQAMAFNRRKMSQGKPEEQAVALCWLLHVLGDLHQPLHTTAAFSVHALDPAGHPHGDAGGNAIHLAEHDNLHALWDAAPDENPDPKFDPAEPFDQRYNRAYARAVKQAETLLADKKLVAQGQRSEGEQDPQRWVCGGFKLAQEKVYTAEIRQQILAADKTADKPSEEPQEGVIIKLPDGYRAAAHEIGKLRVVQAGYRMAEFLKGL